ncbi:MAG: pantoate--beta-alanine ligase [Planctomycetota bacterium]|jgi:pantoate--beta-alanine ligase
MLSVNRRASDVRTLVKDWRATGRRVGFVPTMGALHEGHGALIRASIEECDRTIVSVFVNPLQFEHAEDLKSYPRDEKADQNFIEDLGANALFLPSAEEMYPDEPLTIVTQKGLTAHLDGAARPGFFDGILTVVLKLFNMVDPDVAYFGKKDFQQVAVINRMVTDLNMNVEIRGMPTARDRDGVALASRNKLLTTSAREEAPRLYEALENFRTRFFDGETDVSRLTEEFVHDLSDLTDVKIDYASVVDPKTLSLRTEKVEVGDVLAIAVFLGPVRMIDNITLDSNRRAFYR